MEIIYIVTEGSYSDYSIHSVWSIKEKAEDMVKILNCSEYGDARIEEYTIDVTQKEKIGWLIIKKMTGEIIEDKIYMVTNPYVYYHGDGRVEAHHFTRQQAIKSVYDKMAEIKAQKIGI